jgi:hypothetical protein
MRPFKNLGMILLGIWLILTGILPFLKLGFQGMGMILAVLAVLAGILIIAGR